MTDSDLNKKEPIQKKSKGILLSFLVIFLILAAGLFYNFIFSEMRKYFLVNEKTEKIIFNTNQLEVIYKNFSSIPYNYCQDFKTKKKFGIHRIFLLGEASLTGWPFSKEQSVGKKIENNLRKFTPNLKFEIITISFAGFNSNHALEIVSQIVKYEPDLIILYCGHNEFYGYNGSLSKFTLSKLFPFNLIEGFLTNKKAPKIITYDNQSDDFELLLPLYSTEKFINNENSEYKSVLNNFYENLLQIASLCRENGIELILSYLTDNNLLPPIGIYNSADQLSADIIFNNARMALLRDGNLNSAEELFIQSKELDVFRLRIPKDFSQQIKKVSVDSNVRLADIKDRFAEFSQNHIPGNDLFIDYLHPNITGLEIIAAEYTKLIINKFINNNGTLGVRELLENKNAINPASNEADLTLANNRMEKAAEHLRYANLSANSKIASSGNYGL